MDEERDYRVDMTASRNYADARQKVQYTESLYTDSSLRTPPRERRIASSSPINRSGIDPVQVITQWDPTKSENSHFSGKISHSSNAVKIWIAAIGVSVAISLIISIVCIVLVYQSRNSSKETSFDVQPLTNELARLNERQTNQQNQLQTSLVSIQAVNETTQRQASDIAELYQRIGKLDIRLVGGRQTYGRVEVFYNGEWGTVCDDGWDTRDGTVVCRMLGYRRALTAPGGARYGAGTGRIWLDNVNCMGTESTIYECGGISWGVHDCTHFEDASVSCV